MPQDAGPVSCNSCALACAAEVALSILWRNKKFRYYYYYYSYYYYYCYYYFYYYYY